MGIATNLETALSSLTMNVRRKWASEDPSERARADRLIAEIIADKLGLVEIRQIDLAQLNAVQGSPQ